MNAEVSSSFTISSSLGYICFLVTIISISFGAFVYAPLAVMIVAVVSSSSKSLCFTCSGFSLMIYTSFASSEPYRILSITIESVTTAIPA